MIRKVFLAFIVLATLLLTACAKDQTTSPGTVQQPVGMVMGAVPPANDWQYAVEANVRLQKEQGNQRLALAAACSSGMAQAKSDIQFAMAALAQAQCLSSVGAGNAPSMAINAPPKDPSGWDRALQVGDRVLGLGLQALGLKYQRDQGIATTQANRDVMVQAFGATQGIASAGFSTASTLGTAGFTALATQPVPSWQVTAGGDVLVGNGNSTTRTTSTTTTTDRHDTVTNPAPTVVTCTGTPLTCQR